MKKSILFFIVINVLFLLSKISDAQTPNWLWAKSAGRIYSDQANSVATDKVSGNVYVAGWFSCDTLKLGSTSLVNAGDNDIFLTKYDANGNVLWARRAGGDNYDYANSIAVDASGNIYVAGYFESDTARFGSYILLNTGGTDNTADMFLAKYDANGNVLWVRNAAGLGDDKANSVAIDASGNAYVTGSFTSFYLTFGTVMLTNADTTSYTDDIFIAKYTSSGSVAWAKRAGDLGWEEALSVSVDASSNIYIAGNYNSPTISIGTTTLTNIDNSGNTDDVFLIKYNTSGNVQWAKSAGGKSYDYANSVVTDATGNIFVGGEFSSPFITFGTSTLTNNDSVPGNSYDLFLAKYDASGNPLWAKSTGGDGDDAVMSVDVNTAGNAYITGFFNSPGINFGTTVLTNNDTNYYYDIFISKFDAAGNVLWAKSSGGSSDDGAFSIAVDATGNAYVVGGFYSPTMAFGTTTLTDADNTTNTEDLFVAKLSATSGINEFGNSSDISIFPNPASNSITIETPQKSFIEILNPQGQLIQRINTCGNNLTIDVSAFAKGLYFVKIKTEEGFAIEKFVKE